MGPWVMINAGWYYIEMIARRQQVNTISNKMEAKRLGTSALHPKQTAVYNPALTSQSWNNRTGRVSSARGRQMNQ